MARLPTSFIPVKTSGFDRLNEIVSEWMRDPSNFEGGLTVTGHRYWVILEYGSSPRESDPAPNESRDAVLLKLPRGIPASKRHAEWYPIRARRKAWIRYLAKDGQSWVQKAVVYHPGISARGFLRRTIAEMDQNLQRRINEQLKRTLNIGDIVPRRRDLTTVFNRYLKDLLQAVKDATPVAEADAEGFLYDDGDGTHLRDAWQIVKTS